ncbi:PhzF family phenazine biosynthesis isomerase [Cytobacillus sp. Hz8]|uniref:PhzF family phenazine biosynthesis isomerase n=1 Tax=Cytobacillus sp. Hz8 TaxID=3347168 RepID=UPI0035E2FD8F
MKSITVYHYDAFSHIPNKGNPAGIVLNGDQLSEDEMQNIAYKVGFNETTFPLESDVADLKLRYFTPGHEMNLCGHGTLATIYCLKSKGLLKDKNQLMIETKAGILPIKIMWEAKDRLNIMMKQATPQFKPYTGSIKELASAIGIEPDDIDRSLPIMYGSTGTWTLLVPIKSLATFSKMIPCNSSFPSILAEQPTSSIHPFTLETYHSDCTMHGRHFSSPYSGTIEDPVTGTASGVMGAYYAKYINRNFTRELNLMIEQGQEISKAGFVKVKVKVYHEYDDYEVEIAGTAVYVNEFVISK